jgi:LacI family repressor for deo operon, udp, cdd, tsx, nupC, and nupG
MMTWVMTSARSARTRVTIADVAREAGVNKGTVSRALRGSAGVGRSTRERIVQTAVRLDYSASHIATALATGDSRTVGIVLPTLRSWYFSEVASGASEVLTPAGFRVELINLGVDADYLDVESPQFRHLFSELGGGRGRDALLFAGTVSMEQKLGSGLAKVPAALVGLPLNSVPGIYIDHREGGRLVARHLLQLGHRRMAIVDGRPAEATGTTVWDQRTAGFLEVVREAGLDVPDRLHLYPGDCQAEDGVRALQSLLGSQPDPMPTAIFCHSDPLAFGALSVLRQSGLRCPQDVAVAAFDDHPMSRYWGLTTVTQHAHEQGVRAAQALISTMHAGQDQTLPPWSPDEGDLTVQLVVRESTCGR